MENKSVYVVNEKLNNQLNAIAHAKHQKEMANAIHEYMNNIAIEWWKHLSEETKQAIRLVGFNHSVICSLMFFSSESVMTDYYPIRTALDDMVEAQASLITGEYPYNGMPIMPHDVNNHKYFWGTSEFAIQATYYLNKCKKQLTEEVQNVARMYGIEDTESIVKTAIEHSSVINDHKKNKAKYVYELRKEYLHEVFAMLKKYDSTKGE